MTAMDWIPEALAEELADKPDWQERALCAQTDPEAFFPEKGGSTRDAKRICLSCDVKDQCLAYALDHQERFGIWGGLSERERRKLAAGTRAVIVPRQRGPRQVQLSDEDTTAALELLRQGLGIKAIFRQLGCSRAALERLRDQYLMNGEAA